MDILFSGATVLTMENDTVLQDAFVGVTDGKICYVSTVMPEESADRVIDCAGKVLMPGFVDCHTHLPMAFLRGYSDDCNLQEWLNDHIFPAEAKLTAEAVEICTRLGIAEALSFGITSCTDMYGNLNSVFKAAADIGIKLNGSNGAVYFADEYDFGFETCSETVNLRDMHEKWHNFDNGRLKVDASIHAEYTSSYPLWDAVAEYAINNGLRTHIHISETKTEHESCLDKYGLTPTELFDCHKLWQNGGVAAHGVWLDEEDMKLLARRGVTVAHNAVSNQKLGSGTADVVTMMKNGVNVALGTDSVASNNNLDMFEEMKAAALLAKNRSLDPTSLSAFDVLKMATVNGARAQGREQECGKIARDFDADIILVDFDKPHLFPCHNVISNLVYAAKGSDVCLTMVRGKVLYENGKFTTIDMKALAELYNSYVKPLIFGN